MNMKCVNNTLDTAYLVFLINLSSLVPKNAVRKQHSFNEVIGRPLVVAVKRFRVNRKSGKELHNI